MTLKKQPFADESLRWTKRELESAETKREHKAKSERVQRLREAKRREMALGFPVLTL